MQKLLQNIKDKKFYNVYLFYGEETYLVNSYVKQFKNHFIKDNNINYKEYNEQNFDENLIISDINTAPFFSDYKFIYIKNASLFSKKYEKFNLAIKDVPQTTIVLISETTIDKRKELYKIINKVGEVAEFKKASANELSSWVKKHFAKYNIKISDKDAYKLIYDCDNDMYYLHNEIMKLSSIVEDGVISSEEINKYSSGIIKDKIFDMLDALSTGDINKTLNIYKDLIALREPAMKILSLLYRHYNILIQLKGIENKSKGEIASNVKIPPFTVDKYLSISRKYSHSQLKNILNDLLEIDEKIKMGRIVDSIALDTFIMSNLAKEKKLAG